MYIYLDNAATTPVDPRVAGFMKPYFTEKFGNPSSTHRLGMESREAVEAARKQVADLIGANSGEIVFTSGGTESDNTAIKGIPLRTKGTHIITTAIEHHAVLHTFEYMQSLGVSITVVPVNREGLVDPDDIRRAVTRNTVLISAMHANNEIGTLQPIAEIGHIAKEHDIPFHTDAVQTFGHVPIDVDAMNIDFLALSAHKLYGPKGVGALYIREKTPFTPLLHGGSHESGRRSSTHNVPGIVGLGKAALIAASEMEKEGKRIGSLRDRLLEALFSMDGVHLNGHREKRLANNINLSLEHVEGESLLMELDTGCIAASSGSACSAGSTEASHVLLAIGCPPELARGSLRLTLGRFTTEKEIDMASGIIVLAVERLRALSPWRKGT